MLLLYFFRAKPEEGGNQETQIFLHISFSWLQMSLHFELQPSRLHKTALTVLNPINSGLRGGGGVQVTPFVSLYFLSLFEMSFKFQPSR